MSSKRWLKRNGLAAKKLTIYDALGGTMVKQKAKYVPILDKYVISQVFNEVLPLAHVTGSKKEINLINPGAIDLKVYEDKVSAALNLYRRRLETIVWNALSEEEREHLEPDSFLDNRQDYMEALERLGWPVTEKDIILLEEEIESGERYINKSQALRRHIKEHKLGGQRSKVTDLHRTPRSARSRESFGDAEKDSDEEDEEDVDGDNHDSDKDSEREDDERLSSRSHDDKEKNASDKDVLSSSSSPEEEDEYLSSEKDSHEEVDNRFQYLSI